MWFAVAIIGIIGIATGITLLPGSTTQPKPAQSAPATTAAPAAPSPAPSAPGSTPSK